MKQYKVSVRYVFSKDIYVYANSNDMAGEIALNNLKIKKVKMNVKIIGYSSDENIHAWSNLHEFEEAKINDIKEIGNEKS